MTEKCKVEGCGEPVFNQKWKLCRPHLRRFYRHGDPLGGGISRGVPLQFLKDLLINTPSECVIWPFGYSQKGYGCARLNGKSRNAQRVSLILKTGKDPEGMHACHRCNNPSCVNPDHIYWGTPKENMADRLANGTENIGTRNPHAKLSEVEVMEIFSDPRSPKEISDEKVISETTVYDIKSQKSWGWLTKGFASVVC